ncbi:MAG TPA: hypothetical protein VF134_06425 [Candidatus Dormibacteraeota bacterium]
MRAGLGWIWGLITLVIAFVAGGIGYAIGISTRLPATGADGGPYPYPYFFAPHFFFFPFFGLFWLLLILFLVFGIFRRRRWYGGGWGGPHHHSFEEWHRRQHEPGSEPPAEPKVQA